jgi:hypothetical protein
MPTILEIPESKHNTFRIKTSDTKVSSNHEPRFD